MVHNVEKLSAKLRVEAIRDLLNVVVLEHGEVEVQQSGSDERVAPQIAAQCDGVGDSKALRFDVAHGIA